MNIELHISQLLYRYQCVTVPGFGAFLTEIQSAKWIESANSFYPPKKMISFNTNIKNNDGLLANHIALVEKTSYNNAVSAIQHEVLDWKKSLENNGVLTLKNIGEIKLNADERAVFIPFEQNNYLKSSFGLSSFVSPYVKREILQQKEESSEENDVIVLNTENSNSRSYLKYAAIFILGLGLAGTIGYPLYQNEIANQKTIVEKAVQQKVESKIQEATFLIKSPMPTVTLSVKETKMSYHVMAGAFRDERNAEKIFKSLSNKGYKARRIPQNKYGLFPVLYGSYATFSEAEKVKREIQENENPEAWLLIESL